jgi:hypothetical protein
VSNLYKIIDSILAALNEDAIGGDRYAEILYEQIDQTFISATMYLADLTNILKKLINVFQLEYLSISLFRSQLDSTLETIQIEFIGSEPNYGTIFKKYLEEHNSYVPQFVTEYSVAIIKAIKNRFPESELYGYFSIFDPKELPDDDGELDLYGNQELEFLGDFYGEAKNVNGNEFSEIINKERIKQEWDIVKFYLLPYKNSEMDFIQLWKHILDNDELFSFSYPNVTLLVKIALLIPLSNAHVERIFSQTNLIKNKIRNKMNIDTLDKHLMILLNGPEIEKFNFKKAYEHWESKKSRRSSYEN